MIRREVLAYDKAKDRRNAWLPFKGFQRRQTAKDPVKHFWFWPDEVLVLVSALAFLYQLFLRFGNPAKPFASNHIIPYNKR